MGSKTKKSSIFSGIAGLVALTILVGGPALDKGPRGGTQGMVRPAPHVAVRSVAMTPQGAGTSGTQGAQADPIDKDGSSGIL